VSDPVSRLNKALEGRYRIERELGQGGMATVYLADDLRHARQVALKVLRPELAAVVGAERFLAEIRTTAGLQHPHILPLFDSGEADGFLFYVMPFVKGESLEERLRRERQLPVEEAVRITEDLAEALDYAHRQGVIHRDIKPANVLLLEGKPVVADFGIALAVGAAGGGRLTETGLSLGTPHYMSPEQATGDVGVGPPADIYSLGAVLYEMLVGEPPYTGSTAQAILGKIITGKPDPVAAHRSSVPAHVEAVIRRALEKVPADRFRTAKELADALGDPGFTHGETLGGAKAAASPDRWRAAAIGAMAVAVVAVGWAVTSGSDATSEPLEPDPMRVTLVSSDPEGVRIVDGPIAISPDGSNVVFTGSIGGQRRLYRRSLADPGLRGISGVGEIASAPDIAFSPDGLSVAYTAYVDGRQSLRRVSVDGGRSLAFATLPQYPIGMSWSESAGLVMGMFLWTADFHDLYRVELGDTAVLSITGLAAEASGMYHGPYVLEGGESALYIDWDHDGVKRLATVSIASGERRRFDLRDASFGDMAPIVGIADGVLLYRDEAGTLMAVGWDPATGAPMGIPAPVPGVPGGMREAALAADGTLAMLVGPEAYDLVLVDDRGNPELTLSAEPVHGALPRFSPDGGRIALSTDLQGGPPDMWIYDVGSGLTSRLSLGFRASGVAWSPDGSRVLGTPGFVRRATGRMVSRPVDGSVEAEAVVVGEGWHLHGVDLTRRGTMLAVAANQSYGPYDPLDIVVRDLTQDTTFTAFVSGAANEVAPRFSPDGRWLAYASDESGIYQVYVRPFPGPGPRIQVSDAGGGQPVWSADGRRLFYQTEDAIVAATLDRGTVPEGLSVVGREQLFRGEFFGGPGAVAATYDVDPDGRRLIVTRAVGSGSTEIVVWKDWLAELKDMLSERNP
jgi:Tol biopolymer transport system component